MDFAYSKKRRKRDPNLVFAATAGAFDAILRDNISATNFAQAYVSAIKRTRVTSAGLFADVADNTVVIDHVGASLIPAMRVEPAGMNLLFNSNTFTAAAGWTLSNITTEQNAVGPSGAANEAWTLTDASAAATGTIYRQINKSSSDATTYFQISLAFAKVTSQSSYPGIYLEFAGGAASRYAAYTVDRVNGTLTAYSANNAANIGYRIVSEGDFWRVWIWAQDNNSNTKAQISVSAAVNTDGSGTWIAATQGTCVIANGMITTGKIPSSYFTGATAIGAELVTDGGFAAVTATNAYTSNFSADANGFTATAGGAVAGNIDGIGGQDDVMRFTLDALNSNHFTSKSVVRTEGNCYRVRFKYYLPAGQSNVDGIDATYSGIAIGTFSVTDTWTSVDSYINAGPNNSINFFATDGGATTFQDAGGDDVFYIKDVIIDAITFTNWTAGTGWAPQAVAGVLTGKASKVAGTASDLEQDVSAVANTVYLVSSAITRSAGTLEQEVGGVEGGNDYSASTTAYDYIIASGTGNLKYKADASFSGTVDTASVKTHGTVRASEAKTISMTTQAALLAALADAGTVAIKIRFPFAKTHVSADTNILAFADSATSFLYMDSSGVFTLNDGTNTATNNDSFSADTDYILVARFKKADNDMSVGLGAPGSVSFDAAGTFDGAYTTTGNTTYIGHTIGHGVYIHWIKAWNDEKDSTFINSLR